MRFKNSTILVTGGTGTFGNAFIRRVLECSPKKVIVYSRDEFKQYNMEREVKDSRVRYFIGDVRDANRLARALHGVDYVVHAAAMKQVPACEYNPNEAIKTNIIGAMNVIDCAIDAKVKKVVALSTDKAVHPINLYGATKLCSDKLFTAANAYSGEGGTVFCIVRYGNVAGSRGSVIPLFKEMVGRGVKTLPLTHEEMTRFYITIDEAVDLVFKAFEVGAGGDVFVKTIPSFRIRDFISSRGCKPEIIGIRPGEKIHEIMITEDDAPKVTEHAEYYIIHPEAKNVMPAGFKYSSDVNETWLFT